LRACGPAKPPQLPKETFPWLRALGLANGSIAFLMVALVAEFHTVLAVLIGILGVFIGFTAAILKPATDRAAIYRSEP
jgi:uncharacterized membrane protein